MAAPYRDPGLDTLLDLNGETYFVDEVGHWVKFEVRQVKISPERPHGIRYSLTLHAPDGIRLAGFDNSHPVKDGRGPGAGKRIGSDHRHRLKSVRPYDYRDAGTLPSDFWKEVDGVLQQRGPNK